jgi:hypothetical protein
LRRSKSIFSAFEGGHLDGALFGRATSRATKGGGKPGRPERRLALGDTVKQPDGRGSQPRHDDETGRRDT